MIFNSMTRRAWFMALLFWVTVSISGCTLASPFNQLVAQADEPTATTEIFRTPRPTFTATVEATATPTQTPTPTITPVPTDTATPSVTPTPRPTRTPSATPTNSPAPPPPPPPPTQTPLPTNTPAPSWPYTVVELYSQPTQATLLSIMVAIQTPDGGFVPGLRLVGVDPNGVVTKSEPSADQQTGHTPPGEVVKAGNTKFEPISNYVTGTWLFHLETADGTQVSDTFTIEMDAENRSWYFIRFFPS